MLTQSHPTRTNPARLSLDRLCVELARIADNMGVPGRRAPAAASAPPSRVAAGGGEKTPHAAPSADVLRLALGELPNLPGGAFDSRDAWVDMAHAVKGAAIAGGVEIEGRNAFVQWSQQWGGDPDEPGRVWDGIANAHTGWGCIMRMLRAENPAGAARVKDAEAAAVFALQATTNRTAILNAPFAPVAPVTPAQIPPRRWLYGRSYIAGFLSMLVAPGGAGKSALAVVEAVAMASGRELLAGEQPVRPVRVWFHNAEDDVTEMARRLAATLMHFGQTNADLNANLFLTSGRDLKLQLARTGCDGPEIVPGVVDALVERLVAAKIDVLILDPLGALHTLPENSNEAANLLLGALREVAHRADVALMILHHAGKAAATDMDTAGAGASRGASAFVDAARDVRQLVRMTDKDAARFGIADTDRRDYLRVENGKANLSRAEGGRWLRLAGVPLGNGMGLWPRGDTIGVVERWTPPTAQPATSGDLARVQTALGGAPALARADQRSPEWVGWLVANALALDAGNGIAAKDRTPAQAHNFTRVRALLDGWLRDGGLILTTERDPVTRKDVKVIRPGTPAVLMDTDAASGADNDNSE
jgi:hypothetical protein